MSEEKDPETPTPEIPNVGETHAGETPAPKENPPVNPTEIPDAEESGPTSHMDLKLDNRHPFDDPEYALGPDAFDDFNPDVAFSEWGLESFGINREDVWAAFPETQDDGLMHISDEYPHGDLGDISPSEIMPEFPESAEFQGEENPFNAGQPGDEGYPGSGELETLPPTLKSDSPDAAVNRERDEPIRIGEGLIDEAIAEREAQKELESQEEPEAETFTFRKATVILFSIIVILFGVLMCLFWRDCNNPDEKQGDSFRELPPVAIIPETLGEEKKGESKKVESPEETVVPLENNPTVPPTAGSSFEDSLKQAFKPASGSPEAEPRKVYILQAGEIQLMWEGLGDPTSGVGAWREVHLLDYSQERRATSQIEAAEGTRSWPKANIQKTTTR